MNCKTCDYPLWQIRDRQCPECGAAFKPSDFEFNLNAVKYCCPHCAQQYYGTGPQGQLVPKNFACVSCGQQVDMDEMILLPADGVKEEQTGGLRMPWLEPSTRRGFFSRFFGTVGQALVMPGRMMQAVPPESSTGKAAGFAILVNLVVCVVAAIPFAMLMVFVGGIGGGGGAGMNAAAAMGAALAGVAAFLGIMIGVMLAGLALTTVVAHGMLRVTGGCAYGIGRTWQALCYSSGANVVSAVPCIGYYFGWIWWMISGCIAVKEAQRVHGGRATLAVLAFPLLSTVALIAWYIFMIYSIVSMGAARSAAIGGGFGAGEQARIQTVTTALVAAAPNTHIAQEMIDGSLNWYELVDIMDSTSGGGYARASRVRIGGTTIDQFAFAPRSTQVQNAQAATAALPRGTIAYRVGDTVLTHWGITPDLIPDGDAAEDLWVVVGWPESLAQGAASTRQIWIGTADDNVRSVTASTLTAELATQNQLRASVGLAPLPHPATIPQNAVITGPGVTNMAIPAGGTPAVPVPPETPFPDTQAPASGD